MKHQVSSGAGVRAGRPLIAGLVVQHLLLLKCRWERQRAPNCSRWLAAISVNERQEKQERDFQKHSAPSLTGSVLVLFMCRQTQKLKIKTMLSMFCWWILLWHHLFFIVLCFRWCWMTRHRSEPPCRVSVRSWRKCQRFATSRLWRNSWSKLITKWKLFKRASQLLCLNYSTLRMWDLILSHFLSQHCLCSLKQTLMLICFWRFLSLYCVDICSHASAHVLFSVNNQIYWFMSCFLGGGSHWEWSQEDGEWCCRNQEFIVFPRDFPQPQRGKFQGEMWRKMRLFISGFHFLNLFIFNQHLVIVKKRHVSELTDISSLVSLVN